MIREVNHDNRLNGAEMKPVELPPEPDYETLDPASLTIFSDATGKARATIRGDRSFLDIRMVRCFPQSDPDRFWALTDRKMCVIGIVANPSALDENSQATAAELLRREYFVPVITAVYALKEEFGAVYFEVETDRGRRSFVSKGVRESVEEKDDGEIMLADVDDNRYIIPDWTQLDANSRRLIERIV